MALRFRKSIKLPPGLQMSLIGSGWSLGSRSASDGIDYRVTNLNSGILGTSLYSRQMLSGESSSTQPTASYRSDTCKVCEFSIPLRDIASKVACVITLELHDKNNNANSCEHTKREGMSK